MGCPQAGRMRPKTPAASDGPLKSATQKKAEALGHENVALKREALEQEERLKRLQAKVQKMEQDMASLLRKRGGGASLPQQASASAVVKGARDEEVERLEAAIHDRQFRVEAINKQLLIIKHTVPGPGGPAGPGPSRKPMSSIYGGAGPGVLSAYGAPAKRPASAGPAHKRGPPSPMMSGMSQEDMHEIIGALQRELKAATERLRSARNEVEAKGGSKSDQVARDRAWRNKSTDELRKAVEDIKAQTTMLQATEEQRTLKTQNMKQAVERTEPVLSRLRDELADLQRANVDLMHQKKLIHLRKGEHGEISAQVEKLRNELELLEDENTRLRAAAFGASEVIQSVVVLGNAEAELRQHNGTLSAQLQELSALNVESEKELALLESDDRNSISRLQMRGRDHDAKAKLLQREIKSLREKLSTFGVEASASGQMDKSSVREARLLAQRMGVPMYMRVGGGEGAADQNLDEMRREIRRLKVLQATELREIGKLRQMLHTQEHLMRHTAGGGTEGERELAKIRRQHNNKVAALQRRIALVESKTQRLQQTLAQSRVDKLPSSTEALPSSPEKTMAPSPTKSVVSYAHMVAGRGVVSVVLEGLVLNKDYADFSRNEPTTLLVLDFFLHDIQHSSPLRGLAPPGMLHRDLEVAFDDLFLHFLYYDSLSLQLMLVRGLEFHAIAEARVPLRPLIEDVTSTGPPRLDTCLELLATDDRGVGPVGRVNLSVQIQASIAEQARHFVSRQQVAASSSPGSIQRLPSAAGLDKTREKTALLEEFSRHVGCTYVLVVKILSVSESKSGRVASGRASATDAGPKSRRRFVALHQLLDFPVNETDTISVVAGSQASLFAAGAAPYKIPANPEWDRRLIAGRLEMVLVDQSDPSDEAVGSADLLLTPLTSRRGITATVPLLDSAGQVSAYFEVEVAWEPEPLFESGVGLSARELFAMDERLAVIRTWIKHLGLGDLKAATKAVYESWENRDSDIAAEGLSRAQWVAILRQVKDDAATQAAHKDATLQSITEAEMVAVFNYLTEDAGAGAGSGKPVRLQKEALVNAIVLEGGGSSSHSTSAAHRDGASSVGGGGSDAGDFQALRVRIEKIRCFDNLKKAAELDRKELALRASCLGGKFKGQTASHVSAPFDNSSVAGGFVPWVAEWGRGAGERTIIRQAMQDEECAPEDACIDIELCRVGPGAALSTAQKVDTDLVLGVCRLPLRDFKITGDTTHAVTVEAIAALPSSGIKAGDPIAEVHVDVSGSRLLAFV